MTGLASTWRVLRIFLTNDDTVQRALGKLQRTFQGVLQ